MISYILYILLIFHTMEERFAPLKNNTSTGTDCLKVIMDIPSQRPDGTIHPSCFRVNCHAGISTISCLECVEKAATWTCAGGSSWLKLYGF